MAVGFVLDVSEQRLPFLDYRRNPHAALLPAWVLWATVSVIGDGWQDSLRTTGGFAITLCATYVLIEVGGRAAVARTLGFGLGIYALGAAILIKSTGTAAQMDDRLALASLEPNELARVAALGTLGALWYTRESRGLPQLVAAIASCVGIFMLLATASRTGALGLVVALAVLTVHVSRRRLAALSLGLFLLLATLPLSGIALSGIGGVADANPVAGLAARSTGQVTELGGRSTLWPLVMDEVAQSPLIGIGLANDRDIIADLRLDWSPQHAHNLVLHLLLTTGAIGMILMLVAIAGGLIRAISNADPLCTALLMFVIIDGISEPVIRVPSFGWFALAAAIILAGRASSQRYSPPKTKSRPTESLKDSPSNVQVSAG